MTRNQKKFNSHLSHVRIAVEHSFGILKERFQSLKELRTRVTGKRTLRFINLWIRSCFILHNILIGDLRDEQFLEGEDMQALQAEWHRQSEEHCLSLEELRREISRTVAMPRNSAGRPVYRAAMLEEAVMRGWSLAYGDDDEGL